MLFAATEFFSVAKAQSTSDSTEKHYLTLQYQKVLPGKRTAYLEMLKSYWRAGHEAQIQKGLIVSWKLYEVSYPNGDSQDYDFIQVTEYPKWASMEEPYKGINQESLIGESKAKERSEVSDNARKNIKIETLDVNFYTSTFSSAKNNLLEVYYLKVLPGKYGEFVKINTSLMQPMNEAIAQASGGSYSWASMWLRTPAMIDYPYNYVAFNGFESLTQMESSTLSNVRKEWSEKSSQGYPILSSSRSRYRNELWRLVDSVTTK
jgi:hypothetical protein